MQLTTSLLASALLLLLPSTDAQKVFQSSSKRGLVFVNNPKYPDDNLMWPPPKTSLNWYYNYQPIPSSMYSKIPQSQFQFVPMLWNPTTTFRSQIEQQVKSGINITHVMGYNEPDGDAATGGSNVGPRIAAENWISQMEPLRKMGIKLGAPAVTGSPRGITWLKNFFNSCADLGTNCTIDFLPLHWYGNFEGMASFMGEIAAAYPNVTMWMTEYALNHQSLNKSQEFFRMSAEYFDRLPFVERYSYFGSFRSDISNVGPNAAMLDAKGRLTDIGSWYLGRAATGNIPSAGMKINVGYSVLLSVLLIAFWTLL